MVNLDCQHFLFQFDENKKIIYYTNIQVFVFVNNFVVPIFRNILLSIFDILVALEVWGYIILMIAIYLLPKFIFIFLIHLDLSFFSTFV